MTRAATRPPATTFRCVECGATAIRWVGRCSECQAWGTLIEGGVGAAVRSVRPGPVSGPAQPIGDHDPERARAQPTGIGELDRVLGGGLVPGSVVLLAGEPGVGKSTLLLDVARRYAERGGRPALIVTGEESPAQVRLRGERTGAVHPALFVAAENDLSALLTHVDRVAPGLLVVDSVQTITSQGVESSAGSVTQIRAVTSAVIALAKERGIATVLVGHVTKDGAIAGPRVLEHLVDVVLHFEGERHSALRIIRAAKNRYGAADEVGCFEMREGGIVGLEDPSGLFLSDRLAAVPGTCVTVTQQGRRPMVTEIQALAARGGGGGSMRRAVSGLDAGRVAMLLAVLTRHARLPVADQEIYAATVGGIAATEPAADLAIALALASAVRGIALPPTVCAIGEVSLSGDVRSVPGLDQRLAEAARLGMTTALVPAGFRGRLTNDMVTRPVATIDAALSATDALAVDLATASDPMRARARSPDPLADGDALSRRRGTAKRR